MIELGRPANERYDVLRTVSEGGRATVLQAIDRMHDDTVALKVHPVSSEDRDDLFAEAKVLMKIRPHPGLPVVRGDFVTEDGRNYVLAMNWIDGTSLQDQLEVEGTFALDEVVEIAHHVANALDHLHGHEPPIVHGDVKPANVVRTASGSIALVDFDIASAHGAHGRIGTAGFVAPEVAAGEKPGPTSDVYGLAATVVALMTGAPPLGPEPVIAGLDLATQASLAKTLGAGLATDPARRPASASKFVARLREALRIEYPTGMVALLATKVVGSARLWGQDPDEMRVALGRLRAIRDEVIGELGGHLITAVNESDRTLVVFREASNAARAALLLHERLAVEKMPAGFELQLRAGVAVGEATLAGGAYTGSVVDLVLALRSIAAPGATIATESTAEMLLGLVGRELSIVSLHRAPGLELPDDIALRGITRPGAETTAALREQPPPAPTLPPSHSVARPATEESSAPSDVPAAEAVTDDGARGTSLVGQVVEDSIVLGGVVLVGLALIHRLVLAPELGWSWLAALVLGLGVMLVMGVGFHVASVIREERREDLERTTRDRAAREELVRAEQDREAARRLLADGFAGLGTPDALRAQSVLDDLGAEFESVQRAAARSASSAFSGSALVVPELIEETYRHGMSALSDALELFESSDGPHHRRLVEDLAQIESRLLVDEQLDSAERDRDEFRAASKRELIERAARTQERGRELVFEAERCTAAMLGARLDLAGIRVDGTQAVVDSVVDRLETTIRRVRRIQDEVRRLER